MCTTVPFIFTYVNEYAFSSAKILPKSSGLILIHAGNNSQPPTCVCFQDIIVGNKVMIYVLLLCKACIGVDASLSITWVFLNFMHWCYCSFNCHSLFVVCVYFLPFRNTYIISIAALNVIIFCFSLSRLKRQSNSEVQWLDVLLAQEQFFLWKTRSSKYS
jgi:hypothetical protein